MGKKLESNFTNMVLVLFLITFIASSAVGYVHELTSGPIKAAKEQKQTKAIKDVIPIAFNNNPAQDMIKAQINDKESFECYPAKKDNKLVGVAIKCNTMKGYGGEISIMVGFSMEGKITGYTVLKYQETPGLGAKMNNWFQKTGKGNVLGMNPTTESMKVTKDGGQVDAITAATISSRAFCDAINRAAVAFAFVKKQSNK